MASGNLSAIREKRDSLNAQVRELIGKVKDDTLKLKEFNEKINGLKSKRDSEQSVIADFKKKRDELNKKIGALVEELKALQKLKTQDLDRNVDLPRLKEQIKKLERIMHKEPLSVKKYDEVYDQLEKLQEKYKAQTAAKDSSSKFKAITQQLDSMRKEATSLHQQVIGHSSNAKKYHEEMLLLFPTVKDLRQKVNPIAKEIQKIKGEAEDYHKQFVSEMEFMKKEDKSFGEAQRKKDERQTENQLMAEADRLMKEFTAGKKLSSEELMIIKQYGKE